MSEIRRQVPDALFVGGVGLVFLIGGVAALVGYYLVGAEAVAARTGSYLTAAVIVCVLFVGACSALFWALERYRRR